MQKTRFWSGWTMRHLPAMFVGFVLIAALVETFRR